MFLIRFYAVIPFHVPGVNSIMYAFPEALNVMIQFLQFVTIMTKVVVLLVNVSGAQVLKHAIEIVDLIVNILLTNHLAHQIVPGAHL